LLDVRFCDLDLKIEGTVLERRIRQLYAELEQQGLRFRPPCWLSDEWFSPDDVPGIAIPFYLAHPRLMKLEDRQMFEVEGGDKRWCMMLLRHEAGHAYDTAYRLPRKTRWREVFGSASKRYPRFYSPKPRSRSFVLHLDWWYAQSHPCEDFAETFAVWLRPRSRWRKRYEGWKALKKLEYVDKLMADLANTAPPVKSRARVDPVHRLRQTLGEHYREKKQRYGADHPDFYDRDLHRLFSASPEHAGRPTATAFLRKIRPDLRKTISSWTGEYAYTINLAIKEMMVRCRELDLRVARPADELKLEAAVLVTMHTMSYLHSSGHRLAL
jgi:hypothetical protein